MLIGVKVQNLEDDVWQLTLQLKDIVDLICAQRVSLPQIADHNPRVFGFKKVFVS